jgi:hypothetical protein
MNLTTLIHQPTSMLSKIQKTLSSVTTRVFVIVCCCCTAEVLTAGWMLKEGGKRGIVHW